MKRLIQITALLLLLTYFQSVHAVVIGTHNSDNCYPFGCDGWGDTYQQVFDSTLFSGDILIETIQFYHGAGDTTLNGGQYILSLSTTSYNSSNITGNAETNMGPDETIVFNGLLPTIGDGNIYNFDLSNTFLFDISAGNLLLTVEVSGMSLNGATFLHAGNYAGTTRVRRDSPHRGYGLVIGLNEIEAIPAPAPLALLGIGLAMLGFSRRKS